MIFVLGRENERRNYEQHEVSDNPLRCPVKLYEFYLSKWYYHTFKYNVSLLNMFSFQPWECTKPEWRFLPATWAILRSWQSGLVQFQYAQQPSAGQNVAEASDGPGNPRAHAGGCSFISKGKLMPEVIYNLTTDQI